MCLASRCLEDSMVCLSALEVQHNEALYKSTFTLLYFGLGLEAQVLALGLEAPQGQYGMSLALALRVKSLALALRVKSLALASDYVSLTTTLPTPGLWETSSLAYIAILEAESSSLCSNNTVSDRTKYDRLILCYSQSQCKQNTKKYPGVSYTNLHTPDCY